jgi:diguanylate cyclase (GGDEF)-like protein
MAASPQPDLELQELRKYFAGRLPERLGEIEQAWAEVRVTGWGAGPLRDFHRLAHSLTGAGSTFGFPEVTRAARELERFLKEALGRMGPPADGSGSRVEALLAELRQVAGSTSAVLLPVPAGGVAAQPRSEERLIFLVEDDPEVGAALVAQLRHYGYGIHLLQSLGGLADDVQRTRPDVLIMDVMFPEGSLAGVEAVAELQRSCPPPSRPRVIFVSSRGDLEARLAAVRAGGDAYFLKPVDISALVEKLDILSERHPVSPFRVLLVADDAELAAECGGMLEAAGMRTEVVPDPLDLLEPLYSFRPDLILMDVYMKGCTGPELASVLRQQETYLSTPILFLATEEELADQLEAIDLGGDDFLTKPIEPRPLIAAVEARARRGRILRSLISHDGLTGLLNHGNLKLQLEAEISRASRDGSQVSYAMIDLDRFKSINDSYGHSAGDRLLRSLALFLRQRLRRSDILGRYGGDELAVILPQTDGPTACRVLDKMRENFSHLRHGSGKGDFTATLSCGVATYPARPTAQLLLEAADAALYTAKRSGRNRVELAL